MLFYVGSVPTKTKNTGSDLNYYITDDNTYMNTLNDGNACWLYTNSETDAGGIRIATKITSIPHFSRYRANDATGVIMQSWGFGVPKQLYIPGYSMDYNSTIYDNYWKSYITDMYDIDTKKLSCFIKMDERPTEEWLRDFYWFDNSIWRINKIIEANPVNKDTTNVELIKVQDRYNYANVNVSTIPRIEVSASTTSVTNTGGNVTIYVDVSDGGNWYVSDEVMDRYSPSASSGHGDSSFTVTIPNNSSTSSIVHHIAVQNDYGVWAYCDITQQDTVLTVTPFAQYTYSDIPWTGGTQMYDVRSTYPWTVTNVDNRSYVTLDPISGTGGTYANHFECTFEESDSLAPRSVKMRFTDTAGNYIDVWKWQEACKEIEFDATGGTKVYNYLSGSTVVSPDWLDFVDNGDGTYDVTARPNAESDVRTVNVYVTDPNGISTTVNVTQGSGTAFNVKRTDGAGNVPVTGGSITLDVISTGAWTGVSNVNWAVLGSSSSTTSATITVTFSGNTGNEREAAFTFTNTTGGTLTFYQLQSGDSGVASKVSPDVLIFTSSGGTSALTVNIDGNWSVVARPGWVTVSTLSGSTSGTTNVTAQPYSGSGERQGTIVVYDSTNSKTYLVTVIQQPAEGEILAVSPSRLTFPASGGTILLTIISNTDWTIA